MRFSGEDRGWAVHLHDDFMELYFFCSEVACRVFNDAISVARAHCGDWNIDPMALSGLLACSQFLSDSDYCVVNLLNSDYLANWVKVGKEFICETFIDDADSVLLRFI